MASLRSAADLLYQKVIATEPLTAREWTQVQLLTEIAWASEFIGAGVEWETVTGFEDLRTVKVLRELQRKHIHFADVQLLET